MRKAIVLGILILVLLVSMTLIPVVKAVTYV